MYGKKLLGPSLIAVVGLAAAIAVIATADPTREAMPAGVPEMKLPEGWTEADMQACMLAGMPGPMHEHLAKGIGEWHGTCTMWMVPGAEPTQSESTAVVSSMMDGRYVKTKWSGEMPGMGAYNGFGINGFDNVSQKFVAVWLDNHSTGLMTGTGELSADGKTLTWTFNFNCPVTKKPAVMREVETITGPDAKTLEMFSTDPKTGKEFKMMSIAMTRKPAEAQPKM